MTQAQSLLRDLPDPIDFERDGEALLKLGLSLDRLISARGAAHRHATARGYPGSGMPRACATVASGRCSTTWGLLCPTSPRPSASTALCSLGSASSRPTRTPGWSSGRTGPSAPTDREHPVTRGLHVGFRAPDREAVDVFWRAGIDAGHPDDGEPGSRPVYGRDYYGGFLLDPDGNGVEAVHAARERPVPDGRIDHLWLRVRDPQASRRFYMTVAPYAGLRLAHDAPDRVRFCGPDFSFSLVRDERPLTEHVHLAFPADADAMVRAFHAAALAAGYEDHGAPGERPRACRRSTSATPVVESHRNRVSLRPAPSASFL
jgi:catechol 2,3-dioxygenase-like lactoylglutathione lyase family enzyme